MSRAREIADRDLAATELILDADNDTSITADTDDQIDIRVGGTDTVVVTPDVLEVKGSHPDLKLLDSDDNNYGGVFYNDGTLTVGSDHGAQHSSSKARISVDGTARVTIDDGGDVDIETGDIFFSTAGKGINLGVTSNTNSNTLDDYEEGSAFVDVEDASGNEMSFYEQDGQYNALYYTKIGNTVYFTVRLYSSGSSGMTGGDTLRISNLPFTAANRAAGRFTITTVSDFALTNALAVGGFINDNSTIAYFRKQDTDGTGSYLTVTESNGPRCDLAGWYHTA